MSEPTRETFSGTGAKGYRRPGHSMEDQVREALRASGHVDASRIEIEMNDETGAVTLSGRVADRDERRHAEECAAAVRGIGIVHNHLLIEGEAGGDRPPHTGDRTFGRDSTAAERPPETIGTEPERDKDD